MRTKTFSQTKPEEKFIIEDIRNGKCTVSFFDNIEEVKQENIDEDMVVQYKYDLYKINVTYRKGLEITIKNNYEKWLDFAKDYEVEKVSAEIRKERDKLLAETDWTQMPDADLSEEKKLRYQKYRQALRDVPEQEGFPYDVEFPTLESEE